MAKFTIPKIIMNSLYAPPVIESRLFDFWFDDEFQIFFSGKKTHENQIEPMFSLTSIELWNIAFCQFLANSLFFLHRMMLCCCNWDLVNSQLRQIVDLYTLSFRYHKKSCDSMRKMKNQTLSDACTNRRNYISRLKLLFSPMTNRIDVEEMKRRKMKIYWIKYNSRGCLWIAKVLLPIVMYSYGNLTLELNKSTTTSIFCN